MSGQRKAGRGSGILQFELCWSDSGGQIRRAAHTGFYAPHTQTKQWHLRLQLSSNGQRRSSLPERIVAIARKAQNWSRVYSRAHKNLFAAIGSCLCSFIRQNVNTQLNISETWQRNCRLLHLAVNLHPQLHLHLLAKPHLKHGVPAFYSLANQGRPEDISNACAA